MLFVFNQTLGVIGTGQTHLKCKYCIIHFLRPERPAYSSPRLRRELSRTTTSGVKGIIKKPSALPAKACQAGR